MNMKTIKYLGMLLVMLALSVSFVSCGSDDDEDEGSGDASSVVGTWELETDEEFYILKFNANGTASLTSTLVDYPEESYTISFKWEQKGNRVRVYDTPCGEDQIGYIEGDKLVCEDGPYPGIYTKVRYYTF